MAVRRARNDDLSELLRIESTSWPEGERASERELQTRLNRYPPGCLVSEGRESRLDGFMTACPLRYDPDQPDRFATWEEATGGGSFRDPIRLPEHNALYIASGVVDVLARGRGVFQALAQGMIAVAQAERFRYVTAGAVLPGYARYCRRRGEAPASEYAFLERRGRLVDPFLEIYRLLGFRLPDQRHVLADYYPDPDSRGYAALVVYPLG